MIVGRFREQKKGVRCCCKRKREEERGARRGGGEEGRRRDRWALSGQAITACKKKQVEAVNPEKLLVTFGKVKHLKI